MAHSETYKEIINMPHHVSSTRSKMSNYQRAAQFTPFWALSGHEDTVRETERYVEQFADLAGDQQNIIDMILCEIAKNIDAQPFVQLTYFEPDPRKKGGKCIVKAGHVFKISRENQNISFLDGTMISFWQLRSICFDNYDEGTAY